MSSNSENSENYLNSSAGLPNNNNTAPDDDYLRIIDELKSELAFERAQTGKLLFHFPSFFFSSVLFFFTICNDVRARVGKSSEQILNRMEQSQSESKNQLLSLQKTNEELQSKYQELGLLFHSPIFPSRSLFSFHAPCELKLTARWAGIKKKCPKKASPPD